MPKVGFYNYDKAVVGSDGVIYKEDLTTEPTSGYIAIGTPTFDATGMTSSATDGAQFSGISGQASLAVEGTILLYVNKDAFNAEVNAANANYIIFRAGTTCNIQHQTGARDYHRIVCSSALDGKQSGVDLYIYTNAYDLEQDGDLVPILITWDQCGIKMFLDCLKIADVRWIDSATKPTFTEILLGSSGVSGGAYTFKNLLISTKRTVIKSSSHKTSTINFYGDSYTMQGNYPQVDSVGRQSLYNFSPSDEIAGNAPYFTLDGNNGAGYDGIPGGNLLARRDSGMIPHCQRILAKNNLFVNKINFWGEGGSGYETTGVGLGQTVPQRIDTSLNGNYPIPDIAVLVAGYNDGTSGGISDPAAYKAAIEGGIAAIKSANSDVKIVITTTPYNTNPLYLATLADILEINAVIKEVADADTAVSLIDIFELFGGATNDGTINFHSDFVHPSYIGQAIYGRNIADVITDVT